MQDELDEVRPGGKNSVEIIRSIRLKVQEEEGRA